MTVGVDGRIAVVTGGASGIGAATVEALRDAGARVVTWDLGAGADLTCDVSDAASVAAALADTQRLAGPPSLLVANAGVGGFGRILATDPEDWDAVFAVNTKGVFLTLQAVARSMIEHGQTGAIVVTASVNGVLADPSTAAYAASKAAVMQLTRVAARELGEHGIRVNAVGPGPTDTAMMADAKAREGYWAEIAAHTPLGRVGEPGDIAAAIVALLGLTWVTGQILMVDGGSSLATARGASIDARGRRAPALSSTESEKER